jgi:hypothetical protein
MAQGRAKIPSDFLSEIKEAKREKTQMEKRWSVAIRMLKGDQRFDSRAFDPGFDRLAKSKGPREGLSINQMQPIFRALEAQLQMTVPSPAVMPTTDQVDDMIKSAASEVALQHWWITDNQEHEWAKGIRWMIQCGAVGFHTFYEADSRYDFRLRPEEPDRFGELGVPVMSEYGKRFSLGRMRNKAISPFNYLWEAGVTEPEESRWMGFTSLSTRRELKDTYRYDADGKERRSLLAEIDNLPAHGRAPHKHERRNQPKDRVEVVEVYWRDGRHAIIAGTSSTMVLDSEWSEDVAQKMPLQWVRYGVVEGEMEGVSPMVQIADLQHAYNRTRTAIQSNVQLQANPQIFVPRTADISVGQKFNVPGGRIDFSPGGGTPGYGNPPVMASHVMDEPHTLREEMSEASGAHGITLGRREPGVKSGVHAQTLSSQDATKMTGTRAEIVKAVKYSMECVLLGMKRHYTERRFVRMLDASGKATFNAISSTDLVVAEVFLDADPLFKESAAARDMKFMQFAQTFPQQADPEELKRNLSFHAADRIKHGKMRNLSHAKDALAHIQLGGEVVITAFDDLDAFEEVFGQFVQTPDFYELDDDSMMAVLDVLATLVTFGKGAGAAEHVLENMQVYPRRPLPPQQVAAAPAMPAPPQIPGAPRPAPSPAGGDPLAGVPFAPSPAGGPPPAGVPFAPSRAGGI